MKWFKKYYWYSALIEEQGKPPVYEDRVIDDWHPFIIKDNRSCSWQKFTLLSWRKISKKEYELFLSRNLNDR